MKKRFIFVSIVVSMCLWHLNAGKTCATPVQQEYVTTTPLFVDGVLYVASSEAATRKGHLRAIEVASFFPVTLWDVADKVPLAGDSAAQPEDVRLENQSRTLLTNLDEQLVPVAADQAAVLAERLGMTAALDAELLLHATRGRRGGAGDLPAGDRESPSRLWRISRSSPMMVERSFVNPAASERDRTLYVGAEDGLLHAFHVSHWDADLGSYPASDIDGGTELWGYLPGSFLPYLKNQPLASSSEEPVLHLDGTPVAKELFLDLNGDGKRSWHTLLAATGTMLQERKSCLFVLDVTDPYHPELLWERSLPGVGVGRTRGVNIGRCAANNSACLYLTTDFVETEVASGINALAINLLSGELLWQFSTTYSASGEVASSTPAVPTLMDVDGDKNSDTLVFGDLMGRLWALDLHTGQAYGDRPVFSVAGNIAEPIGARVAVHDRTAIFGTGGVAGTSDQYQYALYAVEISPEGGTLQWSFPLRLGEKVWSAPVVDAQGHILFATASNYAGIIPQGKQQTSGRIISLNHKGEKSGDYKTRAALPGQIVSAPGFVASVSLTGEVVQFGAFRRLSGPSGDMGRVKILSWRQR